MLLQRERQSTDDNNPFAPPPEGRPDQPWQPRRPENEGPESQGEGEGSGSSGSGSDGRGRGRQGWGGQWSSRQPGRSSGGFGGGQSGDREGRQGQGGGGNGLGGPEGTGLRWDPTDPAQRRARYALLAGMWAFFFSIFNFPEIALLLGALGVYWAISALRAKAQPPQGEAAGRPAPAPVPAVGRPQRTAAVSGLVTAGLALVIVAATFTIEMAYKDFYTCRDDALTQSGALACNDKLPKPLRPYFGVQE
ncbi:hypothetical protein ABT160_31715 [Streptomyces sp. NPDC001941]|uniref:hypothetical protein n=1 Tax=Streptomyces sp. NPDC001941 TaxID=3154659 RepID=UPI003321CE4D